jgi:hypothetical protein
MHACAFTTGILISLLWGLGDDSGKVMWRLNYIFPSSLFIIQIVLLLFVFRGANSP